VPWLPGFNLDERSCWLPLSRGTADLLTRWIARVEQGPLAAGPLAGGPLAGGHSSSEALLPVIQLDPAFCLWSACCFPGATAAGSITELMQLLRARPMLACFAGGAASKPPHEHGSAILHQWAHATKQLHAAFIDVSEGNGPRESATAYASYLRTALQLGSQADFDDSLPSVERPSGVPDGDDHFEPDRVDCEVGELSQELQKAIDWHWREAADNGEAAELLSLLAGRLLRLAVLEEDFGTQLEAAKLAAVKEFAYGAGHEINNPLANISTRAQTLMQDETDPERHRRLATINTQAFRAHDMIADMMLFAKPPKLNRQTTDVGEVVQRVVDELRDHELAESVTISAEFNGELTGLELDSTQLTVALKALGKNSLEAIDGSGAIIFRAVRESDDQDPLPLSIEITDTAAGIPTEVIGHLFEPYFSGREAGRGLGMGLCKAWRIVTDHGGQIELQTGTTSGSTFTLRLPTGVGSL